MPIFNEVPASVEYFIVVGVLITGVSFIGKQEGSLCQYTKKGEYLGDRRNMQHIPYF